MTTYFAFRASPELSESSHRLMENFEKGVHESQSTLFVKVAQLFADEIVDALLLNLVRNSSNQANAHTLENFAGIIKSTVNTLIKQVLGKMSNEDLRPLSGYIRKRRMDLVVNGETHDHIVFETPADFHARFRAVLEKGLQGELDQVELLACMDVFHELSLTAFYDEALQQVKLGFIGRKVADLGGAAIRKGSHSASRRSIQHMHAEDMKHFSQYFLGMLITV
ncbi:MAG: hypothetical protein K0Q68_1933 [Moraxellaceae bacterium]|jgi:hypothetical protein|nr:hypothetical protein [Moraxellaceae bacterium]